MRDEAKIKAWLRDEKEGPYRMTTTQFPWILGESACARRCNSIMTSGRFLSFVSFPSVSDQTWPLFGNTRHMTRNVDETSAASSKPHGLPERLGMPSKNTDVAAGIRAVSRVRRVGTSCCR